MGSIDECHLVAATIPEDRLRVEERYPRYYKGFFSRPLFIERDVTFIVVATALTAVVAADVVAIVGGAAACGVTTVVVVVYIKRYI